MRELRTMEDVDKVKSQLAESAFILQKDSEEFDYLLSAYAVLKRASVGRDEEDEDAICRYALLKLYNGVKDALGELCECNDIDINGEEVLKVNRALTQIWSFSYINVDVLHTIATRTNFGELMLHKAQMMYDHFYADMQRIIQNQSELEENEKEN